MTPLERRIGRAKKALAQAQERLDALEEYPEVLNGANFCAAVTKLPALASEIQTVLVRNTFPIRKKGGRK